MGNYETVKGNIYKFSPTESGELSVFDSDKIIKFYHKDEDCVFIGTGETVVIDYDLEDITSDEDTLRKNCINNIHWQNKNRYKDCLTEANLIEVANNSIAKNYNEDLTIDGQWVYPLNSSYNDNLDFSNASFNKGSLELINNSLSTNSDANKTITLGINQDLYYDDDVQTVIKNIEQKNWTVEKTYNNHLLPKGYTRIDFLENSLGTCGIQVPCPEFYRSEFDVQVTGSNDQASVDGIIIGFGGGQFRYGIIRAGVRDNGNTYWAAWGGTSLDVNTKGRHTVIHMMDNTLVSGEICYRILTPVKEIDEETGEETVRYRGTWRSTTYAGYTEYKPATFYQYFYNRQTRIWGATLSSLTGEDKKQLVPVVAPDGTMGLFDVLQGGFHTNVGSNTFVAGIKSLSQLATLSENLPTAPSDSSTIRLSLPSSLLLDYDELEKVMDRFAEKGWIIEIYSWYEDEQISGNVMPVSFLESTGQQTINTGIIPQYIDSWELGVTTDRREVTSSGTYLQGNIIYHSNTYRVVSYNSLAYPNAMYFHCRPEGTSQGSVPTILFSCSEFEKVDIVFNPSSDNPIIINGISKRDGAMPEKTDFSAECIIGGGENSVLPYLGKYYYIRHLRNGKLKCNFIPVIDSNGEPCMYDKITKQSFYNSNENSSSFIIGVDTKIQLRTIVQSLPNNTDGKTLVISIPADWLGGGDIDSWLSGDFGQEIQQYASDINWTLQFNTH